MSTPSSRLAWVDHLRTAMIVLVVNQHACVTCSHVGDWYYMIDPEPPLPVKVPFMFWQGHLQAFFMGLLFFLAGYFAERSMSRRGTRSFLAERFWRLGVPTLFYMLVIHPFILLVLNPWHDEFPPPLEFYRQYILSGTFLGKSGPLWFAFALLIFSLVFVGIRALAAKPTADGADKAVLESRQPSLITILAFGVGLGVATFLVRIVQPNGTSILNFQLCNFAQYIAAFALGIAIGRRNGLQALATAPATTRAGILALICGPIILLLLSVTGGLFSGGSIELYMGGWHWQSLALSLWEQVMGVGLAAGMLAFFVRYFSQDTPLLRWLSDRSFGVYVFHAPVLVAITVWLMPLHAPALLMAPLLTITALMGSYLFTDLVRRIPGVRNIL